MYASLLSFAHSAGYPALVLLVLAESAGVPVPGETALIAAAVLAGQHRLDITLVIILAAAAAIIGDNLGYLIGRKGGRWLLQRPGPFARQRLRVLDIGDPFFARHGPKAVFLGRWILGLRTWAPWLAGASRMPRRRFVVWNAAGAIGWAATLGLIAYFAGHSATGTAGLFAFAGLIGALAAPVALIAGRCRRRHFPPPGSGPATAGRARALEFRTRATGRSRHHRVFDLDLGDGRCACVERGRPTECRRPRLGCAREARTSAGGSTTRNVIDGAIV